MGRSSRPVPHRGPEVVVDGDIEGGEGVVDLLGVTRADEDGRHGGVAHGPGEGESDHGRAGALGLLADKIWSGHLSVNLLRWVFLKVTSATKQ